MLTIICGEDNISSRNYFLALKKEYLLKGYEIREIKPTEIEKIIQWQVNSPSLFSNKEIYFIEHLWKKNQSLQKINQIIKLLIKLKNVQIIDWEDQSSYELKIQGVIIKEFKPPQSIFKLLDACYPGNLKSFIIIFQQLPPKINEGFIFIMLIRHIRQLLLIKNGEKIIGLQSWQLNKLKSQAKFWSTEKLISFYEGLYGIEVSIKTSKNPFSIKKSLELLAGYLL